MLSENDVVLDIRMLDLERALSHDLGYSFSFYELWYHSMHMKDKVQKSSPYCQSFQEQKEVKLELEVRSFF